MASNDNTIEKTAEVLEKDGSMAAPKRSRRSRKAKAEPERVAAPSTVHVFANLPSGQTFRLPNGKVVRIGGMPISNLRKPNGEFFRGGKYGITEVGAEEWEQVVRYYGGMSIFRNGLVFAAPTLEAGKSMARERGDLRHGFEPIDPRSRRKTRPQEG